jgi:hypothetical protein
MVGGGILTYAWLGIFMEPESGPKMLIDYIGSIFFASGAVGLFVMAVRKLRKSEVIARANIADGFSLND